MEKPVDTTKPDAPDVAPAPDAATPGAIDVDAILAKVQIPPKLKPVYDQSVLKGMRIMFSKSSHDMMEKQLAKEGPLADKMAEGITALIYMLWTGSNKTLPPQIIVPLAFTFTLKAFDFLQRSGDAEATKEVLGEAIEKSMTQVMGKFGVSPDQMPQIIEQMKGSVAGAPAPVAPDKSAGLLATEGGK